MFSLDKYVKVSNLDSIVTISPLEELKMLTYDQFVPTSLKGTWQSMKWPKSLSKFCFNVNVEYVLLNRLEI